MVNVQAVNVILRSDNNAIRMTQTALWITGRRSGSEHDLHWLIIRNLRLFTPVNARIVLQGKHERYCQSSLSVDVLEPSFVSCSFTTAACVTESTAFAAASSSTTMILGLSSCSHSANSSGLPVICASSGAMTTPNLIVARKQMIHSILFSRNVIIVSPSRIP